MHMCLEWCLESEDVLSYLLGDCGSVGITVRGDLLSRTVTLAYSLTSQHASCLRH